MQVHEPDFVRKLPPDLRLFIKQKCGGDWRRVSLDDKGAVIVHNNPVPPKVTRTELPPQGKTATALKKAAAAKKVSPAKPAPPAFQPETPPAAPRAKKTAKKTTAKKTADPSHVRELLRPSPAPLPALRKVILPGIGEADDERLEGNAVQLQQICRHGLPPESDLVFHGEVLAMQGVDLPAAEAAVRHPEMVTIAPETGAKGHVILRFMKGDVLVAVGFRSHPPTILAAYYGGRLLHDVHRVPERSGGGGNKARNGVPTTPGALLMRLEGLGAQIAVGEDELGLVTYKGEELGKIMLGNRASKASVETDWQRTQRRIAAKNKKGT